LNRKLAALLVLACTIAFEIPVYASLTASYHQNGHIRIVNGTNAGVTVSPATIEFGNVTWGSTVTQPITVLNTGDCVENVTATASQPGQPVVMSFIPVLDPSHSIVVNATYDTRVFSTPGDYSFGIDWTAHCL